MEGLLQLQKIPFGPKSFYIYNIYCVYQVPVIYIPMENAMNTIGKLYEIHIIIQLLNHLDLLICMGSLVLFVDIWLQSNRLILTV